MNNIRPFKIDITEVDIIDLKQRLAASRWPDQVNDDNWSYGTEREHLKTLTEYWQNEFDWGKKQQTLNQLNHFLLHIDGLDTHLIHQLPPHTHATTIIISHDWPGSTLKKADNPIILTT